MRFLREILRLRYAGGLSQRAIARCLSIGLGTVCECLAQAAKAGLNWPLPAEFDDARLGAVLAARPRPGASSSRSLPDLARLHDVYLSAGTWEKGRAPSALDAMLVTVSEIFLRIGVTVVVNGEEDPTRFSARVLEDGPTKDVTIEQMQGVLPPSGVNEMNVLFTRTAQCGAAGGGCNIPSGRSIIVPEYSENRHVPSDRPKGMSTILSHEMLHVFRNDRNEITSVFFPRNKDLLLFKDSRLRTDRGVLRPEDIQRIGEWFK